MEIDSFARPSSGTWSSWAIGRIAGLDPATASRISGYRQIAGFRNRLIHVYDPLDDELV